MHEDYKRSITKAIIWRLLGFLFTIILAFIITDDFDISLSIGITEAIVKTTFYVIYERVWDGIKWGKK